MTRPSYRPSDADRTPHPSKARRSFWLAVLLAVAATPLEAVQSGPDGVTVRDSSGIRIVESEYPDTTAPPLWRLSVPRLEVGRMDGPEEYLLFRVAGIHLRDDGGLVVFNAAGTELRWYDREGRHVRTLGRRGEGPGEYRSVVAIHERDDGRLMVVDSWWRRLTILEADGSVAETRKLPNATYQGVLGDGTILGEAGEGWSVERHGEPGVTRTTATLVLVDPVELRADTFAVLPGVTWWADQTGERAFSVKGVPWTPSSHQAVGGDRVAAGWSGDPEVRVFDGSGTLRRIVRWRQEPDPVTSADIDEIVGRAPEAQQPAERRRLEKMPIAEHKPFFQGLLVDGRGNVWVREYERREDGTARWLVFDREGVAAGYVDTPAGFVARTAKRGLLAGVAYDDLGIQRVRVYELTGGGPGE